MICMIVTTTFLNIKHFSVIQAQAPMPKNLNFRMILGEF